MIYTISTDQPINWAASGAELVAQNVHNIISTWNYEVPYMRGLGLPLDLLDMPVDTAGPLGVSAIIEKIGQYEPRAVILRAALKESDSAGNLTFEVVIDI